MGFFEKLKALFGGAQAGETTDTLPTAQETAPEAMNHAHAHDHEPQAAEAGDIPEEDMEDEPMTDMTADDESVDDATEDQM